jgi:hypothetical protein
MKNIFSLQKSKRLFIIGIITLFLSNCGITNNLSPSKQYSGLFSYLATYSYNQNNSFIQLTGTLTGEDGSTPLSGGILYINFNLFSNLSKSAMDTRVNTDSSGNFSMNLNIGNFTVQVYNSSNEYLGSFTMDITSNSIPPTPKINGKFGLINLIVKPINPFENSCGSICGYIAGVSNSLDRLFVYGMEKNNPVIYETLDGETFSKSYVKLGDCVSSYNSSPPIDCKISAIAYENGIYVVVGVKASCTINSPCNILATYYGMGPSLSTISINSINSPATNINFGRTFIFSNGYLSYITFGNPSTIHYTNDGNTFNSLPLSTNALATNPSDIAKSVCNDLFYGENNLAFCGLKARQDGNTWLANTAIINTPTTDPELNYVGSYNKGNYQIVSYKSSTKTSKIYSTDGSLAGNGNFTLFETGFSTSSFLTPIFSTNLYLFSLGFVYRNTGSITNATISLVRSSDSGASYSLSSPTFPAVINNPSGLGSIGNNFFFAGQNQLTSNFSKSYLFKTTDGVTWTTVTLP